ncbi:DUF4430 domain-containing protein [Patescibacteria group bacterium]|nr:DUF4430 domain-containing protein [Patescibacteria group bacterium]MBU2036164.1 DUF4430 domain-containing protein [Patescibacteria group bacterium]
MKKILLYLILTIAFIAGIGFYFNNSNTSFKLDQKQVVEKTNNVTTIIDFGDENKITFQEKDFNEKTAYDLLKKTSEVNNFEIKVKQYDFGVFVEEIDGRKNTNEKAWIYFLNSVSATTAADTYLVSPGDLIEWKYIEPEF